MFRVVLAVALFGIGAVLIGGKVYDSGPTATAGGEPSATATAIDVIPTSELLKSISRPAASSVIASNQAIGADRWQMAGFTGHDVRVAIVDTGFDGYEAQLGQNLPAHVIARSFRADGRLESGSEHGTLAARIVHSIAPRAELYLVNFGTVTEFGQLVDYLEAEHVDVVSFSLGFVHNGPGDGTGEVNDIVSRSVAAGQLWFVAAGNWAQQHWAGTFIDRNSNLINEFAPGVESDGRPYRAGDLVTVSLRWDEPWGFACTDYDLELFGPDGSLVQASRNSQTCAGDPVESLQVLATQSGQYRARIVQSGFSGHTPRLELLMLGAPDRNQSLDFFTEGGSLAEPGDNAGVQTVGAVDPFNGSVVATFSSEGPTKDGRPKPDLIAPTGVASGGELSFSGTSAATPHAAGAAALLFEAFPGLGATGIARKLQDRATTTPLGTEVTTHLLQLGSFEDVGPVLPPGDGLASLLGAVPDGAGIATLHYRGPDAFPARFAHLLLDGRGPSAIYRISARGTFEVYLTDAPRYASTFEVFHEGDTLFAVFAPRPEIGAPAIP